MVKENDGKYKNLLSFNHQDGSILGANAFQGRHLLFRTGYSSAISYIGIAESEKCSEDDIGLDHVDDVTAAPTSITSSPTFLLSDDKLNYDPRSDEQEKSSVFVSEGFLSWPVLTAIVAILLIVILGLLCYRKKRKKRKRDANTADSNDDLVSIGGESNSFVSYGLRSNLFSMVSSKASEQRQSFQQNRNQGLNATRYNSRIRDSMRNMDEGSREPFQLVEANTRPRYGQNDNTHEQLQEPILAQVQPIEASDENTAIAQAEPIVTSHETNHEFSGLHDIAGRYGDPEKKVPSIRESTSSRRRYSNDQPPGVGKSFLVKKGTIHSSDDEEGTFDSRNSRKQARRQLELATGKMALPARTRERRRIKNDTYDFAADKSLPSQVESGLSRLNNRRHTMQMVSQNNEVDSLPRSQKTKANTLIQERRQTMNLVSINDQKRSSPLSQGRTNQFVSNLDNRINPSTRSSSDRQSNFQMDPITTTKRGSFQSSRASTTSSRVSSRYKSRHSRSSKAAALSRAAERGKRDFSTGIAEIPAFRRVGDASRRPPIEEGTMIGTRADSSSVISGLTDIGYKRGSIGSTRRGTGSSYNSEASRRQGYHINDNLGAHKHSGPEGHYDMSDGSISRRGSAFSKRSSSGGGFSDSAESRAYHEGTSKRSSIDSVTRTSRAPRRDSITSSRHSTSRSRRGTGESVNTESRYSRLSTSRNKIVTTGTSRNSRNTYEESLSGELSYEDQYRRSSNESRNREDSMDSFRDLDLSQHSRGRRSRHHIDLSVHSGRSSANSRRSSRAQEHRRSMMMSTIREASSSKISEPSVKDYGRPDQGSSPSNRIRRNRNSLEDFAKYQLDKEMRNRNLPAAPHYRIMPKEGNTRSSMW